MSMKIMEKSTLCRICLAKDVRMCDVVNTNLQETYESLTAMQFETKDRPSQVCYICYAQLQTCHKLRYKSLYSEELFRQVSDSWELKLAPLHNVAPLLTTQLVTHLSIVPVSSDTTDTDVKDEEDDDPSLDCSNIIENVQVKEEHVEVLNTKQTMEKVKKPSYKNCMVPKCRNTTIRTPDKVFFRIPRDVKLRKQWCKNMKKDNISPLSVVFCCEDHFNVKEDTVNYIEYNIMKQNGEKRSLRLKKGVVPHKFLCQKPNMPPPAERMAVVKRQRIALVNEALSEYAIKRSNILEIGELPHTSDHDYDAIK